MRKWHVALFATIIAICTPGITAAKDLTLVPAAGWVLDYHPDKCRLVRTFGEDQERTVLIIEQFAPAPQLSWLVAGEPLAKFKLRNSVKVQWGPVNDPYETKFAKAALDGFGPAFIGRDGTLDPPKDPPILSRIELRTDRAEETPEEDVGLKFLDPKDGAKIEELSFQQDDDRKVTLATGNMEAAYRAMNSCTTDLVASWGLDTDAQKSVATFPEFSNPDTVGRKLAEKYPRKAMYQGTQANFQLRIIVDETGTLASCTWLNTTSAEGFGEGDNPCQIVRDHAQFEPARDTQGNGIKSFMVQQLAYRLY